MDAATFWALIGRTTADSAEKQFKALRSELSKLAPSEILDFDRQLWSAVVAAYHWDVWGAAYLAMGGCSDDMFEYFRLYLVSRGRMVYDAVLRNPDALIDHVPESPDDMLDFEGLAGVAMDVYESKTGQELPIERPRPDQPAGMEWDFEDSVQVKRRMPRLYAAYGLDHDDE